jgi:hypothetical protein
MAEISAAARPTAAVEYKWVAMLQKANPSSAVIPEDASRDIALMSPVVGRNPLIDAGHLTAGEATLEGMAGSTVGGWSLDVITRRGRRLQSRCERWRAAKLAVGRPDSVVPWSSSASRETSLCLGT